MASAPQTNVLQSAPPPSAERTDVVSLHNRCVPSFITQIMSRHHRCCVAVNGTMRRTQEESDGLDHKAKQLVLNSEFASMINVSD